MLCTVGCVDSGLTRRTAAFPQVARLYLVSDILHNSSATVKNASSYRSEFQECLPDIFESLHRCFASISGRITAEFMKEKVGAYSA